jgi:hypothetical protein
MQETLNALSQGRVSHVLLDAGRTDQGTDLEGQFDYATSESFSQLPIQEQMADYTVTTGAAVTQLWGDTAEPVEPLRVSPQNCASGTNGGCAGEKIVKKDWRGRPLRHLANFDRVLLGKGGRRAWKGCDF